MKKIIGIISNVSGFTNEDIFQNRYYTLNTYVKKIKEAGGVPIIIPPVDLLINEDALKICDAYLIPGGSRIEDFYFKVIDYALKKDKKLLGICMGMQVIGIYANNSNEEKTLEKIDNHWVDEGITITNPEILVHEVEIFKDSNLFKIFKTTKMRVNSIHHYAVRKVCLPFKVVALKDNVIEGIEYKNIIGVQFHPELMKEGFKLFEWLVE